VAKHTQLAKHVEVDASSMLEQIEYYYFFIYSMVQHGYAQAAVETLLCWASLLTQARKILARTVDPSYSGDASR
jgi:hypothetical protein